MGMGERRQRLEKEQSLFSKKLLRENAKLQRRIEEIAQLWDDAHREKDPTLQSGLIQAATEKQEALLDEIKKKNPDPDSGEDVRHRITLAYRALQNK